MDLTIRRDGGPEYEHWLTPAATIAFGCAVAGVAALAGVPVVAVAVVLAAAVVAVWNSPLRASGHESMREVRRAARADQAVFVLWRPGCPYSSRLRRGLTRRGVRVHWVNVWRDAEADALCRSVNHGAEETPTVMMLDPGTRTPVVLSATVDGICDAVECGGAEHALGA